MLEAHDHVGDLHAGVVDVVLHLDVSPPLSQQRTKRVAEAGVAQVTDVGGLVGIDVGVLDDDLPRSGATGGRPALVEARDELGGERSPVEEEVDVTAARDLGFDDALDRGQSGRAASCGDWPGVAS